MFFFELLFCYVFRSQFPSMCFFLILLSIVQLLSASYLRHSRQRQSRRWFIGNRKQSKVILQPKKSLKTLRPTVGSNGRPVTNYSPPEILSISSTPITSINALPSALVNSILRLIVNPETQLSTRWWTAYPQYRLRTSLESRSKVWALRDVQQLGGMGQGVTSNRRRGEEEGDTIHDGFVKLRSLVGKLRETAGT